MPANDKYVDTWRQFETFLAEGQVRAIGVSNFKIPHLERLARETTVVPALNQVELHPRFAQRELRAYMDRAGIRAEAWAPLGQGRFGLGEFPAITEAATAHGKSPAQVILRWHIQSGIIAIPKASSQAHLIQNLDIFDFELTPAELAAIDSLDTGQRLSADPDQINDN
jgi:2,5-diketo-D-gluconate reductase A